MASPAPKSETVTYVLPSQVICLGAALASVVKTARQAMAAKVSPSGWMFETIEDCSRHLGVVQLALTHLSPRLEDLMKHVISNPHAGMAEASRSAGRLEQVLSEFVEGYLDAKASHAGPDDREARILIMGVYRHHTNEIFEWLEELVAVIANPAAALKKRGMDAADSVKLTVALNMTSPPEMAKLNMLLNKLLRSPSGVSASGPACAVEKASTPSLFGMIGALALGVGITKTVLWRNPR